MDFGALYYMRDASHTGAFCVLPQDETIDYFAIARAETDPPRPFRFVYASGSKPQDLIGTGTVSLYLLTVRVFEILKNVGPTGWQALPVEVSGRKGKPVDGYRCLAVTGRCGPVLWDKGRKIRKPPPVPQGRGYDAWVGLFFDTETWDGSDIFTPEGTTYKIVSKRVMEALTRAKVTNIKFTALTDFERSWPE